MMEDKSNRSSNNNRESAGILVSIDEDEVETSAAVASDHHSMMGDDEKKNILSLSSTSSMPSQRSSSGSSSSSSSLDWFTPRLSSRQSILKKNNSNNNTLLTCNKLRFSELDLVGRDNEKSVLKERLQIMLNDDHHQQQQQQQQRRQLILIGGQSGVGKTSLAFTLQKESLKMNNNNNNNKSSLDSGGGGGGGGNGVFIHSKFDQSNNSEPYAAIVNACTGLCQEILALKANEQEQEDDDDDDELLETEQKTRYNNNNNNNTSSFQEISEKLKKELTGMEVELLINAIPLVGQIIGMKKNNNNNDTTTTTTTADDFDDDNMLLNGLQIKELLESAFIKFIRIISLCFVPLIIVLDDLQWTDVGTLELLTKLVVGGSNNNDTQQQQQQQQQQGGQGGGGLNNNNNNNLLLVGCYRSNEIDKTHILSKKIRDLQQQQQKQQEEERNFDITMIEVGNLGVTETKQILMTLLSMDDTTELYPLAELCHRKTMGNVFYLLVFIEMLHKEEYIKFNIGTFTWQWDLQLIEDKTAATANVVELMKTKMNNTTSPEVNDLLKMACCLGSCFTFKLIQLVWLSTSSISSSSSRASSSTTTTATTEEEASTKCRQLLEEAVSEKFLERISDDSVRWAHDKVQEAATLLENPDDFSKRKYLVGQTLHQSLDDKELEDEIFVVVNLLNCGQSKSLELARLNLRAAKKSKELSAFDSQGFYAVTGISNLPVDCWTKCKDLTLELYMVCAEAASYRGDFETMRHYCGEAFKEERNSIHDKVPFYEILIHSLARNGDLKGAIELGIDTLGDLGCKLPRSNGFQTVSATMAVLRFKRQYRKIMPSETDISVFPLMSNRTAREAMKLLDKLAFQAFCANMPMVFLLATLRMVHLTLEFGLADASPVAFVFCATVMMHGLGDWDFGVRVAALSQQMYDRLKNNHQEPCATCCSRALVISWRNPMQGQLRHFMDGYKKGMETGNTDWAFYNVFFSVAMPLIYGRQLQAVDDDIKIYLPQFESLNASAVHASEIRTYWQAALNLMGRSENTTVLTGSALDEEEFIKSAPMMPMTKFSIAKSFVCVHFGDHELGAKLALERQDRGYKHVPGCPCVMMDPFLRAVSLYAMARKKKGKASLFYKFHAGKAGSTVKAWVKNGNPNLLHQLKILDAEHSSLSRSNHDRTKKLYSEAITLSARHGQIQDAGLACERLASYYILEMQDKEEGTYALKEAKKYYGDWGAMKRVELLQKTYAHLLNGMSLKKKLQ